jgi:hypothetical protein
VTSDEFLDMIIDKGVKYTWYFHYMPVGNDASTDLLLNPEQREYMYNRVREIRGYEGGKPIMAIDFQNDGEFVSGCVAGGKYYCHINPAGDVEPCVFIHYSSANIHDKSWIECLQQPLFKDYQANQPFNKNLLRPCPMLENPAILQRLVKESRSPFHGYDFSGACGASLRQMHGLCEMLAAFGRQTLESDASREEILILFQEMRILCYNNSNII